MPNEQDLKDGYDRVEWLIFFNDARQRHVATACGIDETAFSKALRFKKGFDGHWVKLAEFFGVTLDWLLRGLGPSPADEAKVDLEQRAAAGQLYTPAPANLFPAARASIAPQARAHYQKGAAGQLPMLGTVSAGPGDVSFVDNPRRFRWPSEVAVYQVIGNSAYPVAFDGQFILAKPYRDVHDQNLVVVETSEPNEKGELVKKAYLKRYCEDNRAPEGFLLASVNIGYNSVIIPRAHINAMIPVVGVLFEEDGDEEPKS